MKKLSIEQQELLQQIIQGNDLREITSFKALEIIKKQVGNIHVFTDEMPPQQTSIELRNSGLFEIIEQAFDEYLILQKMRAEYNSIEQELGVDLVTLFKALDNGIWTKGGYYADVLEKEPVFVKRPEIGICGFYDECDEDYNTLVHDENVMCIYSYHYECRIRQTRLKDYGKTWALTREELEK